MLYIRVLGSGSGLRISQVPGFLGEVDDGHHEASVGQPRKEEQRDDAEHDLPQP